MLNICYSSILQKHVSHLLFTIHYIAVHRNGLYTKVSDMILLRCYMIIGRESIQWTTYCRSLRINFNLLQGWCSWRQSGKRQRPLLNNWTIEVTNENTGQVNSKSRVRNGEKQVVDTRSWLGEWTDREVIAHGSVNINANHTMLNCGNIVVSEKWVVGNVVNWVQSGRLEPCFNQKN